ncbi:MAG: Uma2 family endonuclease [Microcoleus sp. PH2017_29_MFU_D_A]|uniref:Uma2 family endonuclease n=1 Tax=unclassified Microcoleus TaxID=2642155 RepID=UPI001D4DD028|nr:MULTISPECIES: Uma2 family endonuclease [unclassified Microcoleus]MCC3420165.1 Uma2 family endonuclease [Microcoleus sp. PH2017_07_MST_O_A]MCC3443767.1 Uma2 family endonuclease [Microcoleus sp. PH2017_03_ELD_O_A]MCC3465731.1 Uma2 family endonuclease [Microcoleus sp. PH2017_06_SFM_O_A]MCC3503120.1 Uma2 family endonuclease [Microcoleus sp. PH2017_19_SFW_U_A]MCC3510059.1 Uma2 family endonuclease [Microcoleus sp. PH2017_17_BER_D_A]TAE14852.1 MAG: Uma2 family endonuclease [Oscillatoriales cyanob
MLITEAPFTLRKWTVKEYQKLGEMGFFHPEERVELVSGNIIRMSAKGTAHTSALGRTDRLLQNLFGNLAWVRMQDPIALDDNSEPEPDIAVVRIDPFDYATHHPTPSEVYLIIEVADSSLAYDREIKAKIYARSGIVDYWVLNVNDRQLHVFREPADDGYQSEVILEETASISPLQFPAFNIAIGEMLPPIISN